MNYCYSRCDHSDLPFVVPTRRPVCYVAPLPRFVRYNSPVYVVAIYVVVGYVAVGHPTRLITVTLLPFPDTYVTFTVVSRYRLLLPAFHTLRFPRWLIRCSHFVADLTVVGWCYRLFTLLLF